MPHSTYSWHDPMALARKVSEGEKTWVFLHSSQAGPDAARYSFLCLYPREIVAQDRCDALADRLSNNHPQQDSDTLFAQAWFGYLGYGIKNELETLPEDRPALIDLPHLWMARFAAVLQWDHHTQQMHLYQDDTSPLLEALFPACFKAINSETTVPLNDSKQSSFKDKEGWSGAPISVASITSSMTNAQYLAKVETVREEIRKGTIYQANLTRKFEGECKDFSAITAFKALCEHSPSPYSALICDNEMVIISSSPESFITLDASGKMTTQPIKGSIGREFDLALDAQAIKTLTHSDKDRAENVMIVDLCRHDLSRVCEAGSVIVPDLCRLKSYATIHHLVSTVVGQKKEEVSALDAVKACFPPGSMTGAPKIEAMRVCSALEPTARGVYSGAIGWFGGDGSVDLSVTIRTLIVKGNRFEFQVGGAIVIDSEPEKELEETRVKARALLWLLGLDVDQVFV